MKKLALIAATLVVALVLGLGGFFVVAMGALSSSAAAAGSGASGCVPAEIASTRPTISATNSPAPAPARTGTAASASSSTTAPDSLEIPRGSGTVTLSSKQLAIATAIITVGRQLGISDKGVKVALMTALRSRCCGCTPTAASPSRSPTTTTLWAATMTASIPSSSAPDGDPSRNG